MGQGQAGGTAEASGLAGLNLYDGSDPDQSESPRCTERAPATRGIGTQAIPSAPLCGAQAQGVPGHESR